jgi:hypothetical protein
MLISSEHDEGEKAEQGGGGASDGLIGPLAFGLDAEMARTSAKMTSVYRDRFIRPSPSAPDSSSSWLIFRGARHIPDGTGWPDSGTLVMSAPDRRIRQPL